MLAAVVTPGAEGGNVAIAERPQPDIKADQVMVRVRAAGVNRGEIIARRALRSGAAVIGGIEFAGEIAAVGSDVQGWRAGDRVMGRGTQAQAEYVASDPQLLMTIPQALSFAEAAAIPNVFVTAHDALVTNGALKRGETVLINAASSGVATAAIQIARYLGAGKVIGVSRSREKLDRIFSLGLTDGIATDEEKLCDGIQRITDGKGADIVVDCLGAQVLEDNLKAMALEGRLISVGRMAGAVAPLNLDLLALRRLKLIGVTFRTRSHREHVACVQACLRDLGDGFAQGKLKPVLDRTFPLAEIAAAQDYMETNAQAGKIVLTIP